MVSYCILLLANHVQAKDFMVSCSDLAQWLLFLITGFCENCTAYKDSDGHLHSEKSCQEFCCGTCTSRYCCSNLLQKLDEDHQVMCNEMSERWKYCIMLISLKYIRCALFLPIVTYCNSIVLGIENKCIYYREHMRPWKICNKWPGLHSYAANKPLLVCNMNEPGIVTSTLVIILRHKTRF